MSGIRFNPLLKELRIHLCQTSPTSAGVREFVQKNYIELKKMNPGFPILIRECYGIQPRIYARYEKGAERSATLTDLAAKDVLSTVTQLAK